MQMNISVIIPTYNRAHVLKRALDSVLAQTQQAAEIIVVNDASTDGTADLLTLYLNIKVISLSHNKGVSAARNKGIAKAKGDWIALLDSDDEWLPQKLEKQCDVIKQTPDIHIIHTNEIWIRNGKRVNAMNKHAKPNGWVYPQSLALCCVSPSSILIHRKVFDLCGVFDENLPVCEDYDLWLRCFNQFQVKLLEEPLLIKYGGHDDQLSRKHWGMDRFRVKALLKILDSGSLDKTNQQLTKQVLVKKCEILALGASKRGKVVDSQYYNSLVEQYG